MVNVLLDVSLLFETAVAVVLSYIAQLQVIFGTRSVASPHFGIPSMAFFVLIFFYDEARKIYVRSGIDRTVKGKVRYTGWVAKNTHW